MRKDIKIEKVRGDERQTTSVNIYYSAHDPYVAKQVTGELTNLFIRESARMWIQESEEDTKFLEAELETSHQKLLEEEENIRVFKDQHPELGSNLRNLAKLRSELQNREMPSTSPNSKMPICWNSLSDPSLGTALPPGYSL